MVYFNYMKNLNKSICLDIDNVICKTIKSNYKKSKPIKKNIKFINHLYDQGHTTKFLLQDIWEGLVTMQQKQKRKQKKLH